MSQGKGLAKLRKLRQSINSRLTLFANYIDKIYDDVHKNKSVVPVIEINTRLEYAREILTQFEENQSQIEGLLDEIPEEEIEYRSNFENTFYSSVAKAKQLVQGTSIQGNSSNGNDFGLKLPTIQLPKFSGNFENWMDFHDTFDSMIVKNNNITPIQKFHYLKACLSGAAEKVISSMPLSSSNFELAWQILCDRYANTQLLIHNHIKSIFHSKPIRDNSTGIRQLVDSLTSNLRSLESLGEPIQHWDSLIIFIILEKLDADLVKDWDRECQGRKPELKDLLLFLQNRADTLEKFEVRNLKVVQNKISSNSSFKPKVPSSKVMIGKEVSDINCSLCKGNHKIASCDEFKKLDAHARSEQIKRLRLCFNCLHSGHSSASCKFGKCKTCGRKHHTLLHTTTENSNSLNASPNGTSASSNGTSASSNGTQVNEMSQVTNALSSKASNNSFALLSTVIVHVVDRNGVKHESRGLLDSGSQSNFVTNSLVSKLGLSKKSTDISVVGIAHVASNVKFSCSLKIYSLHSSFSTVLNCLVISSICDRVPSHQVELESLSIPPSIQLSDSNFNVPSDIDILIGAGLFWDLLCMGQIKLGPQRPILQKTKLGWIISGPLPQKGPQMISCNVSQGVKEFDLSQFWEVEECHASRSLSKEELACEEHFKSTYKRNSDGRFIVKIPLKGSIEELGESRSIAEKRFYLLERKLERNSNLKQDYSSFMQEYLSLGHMSRIDNTEFAVQYYLPHHAVVKEDSITTRLRVVFDGSCPTTSGMSVNKIQMTGPVLQSDLLSILIRFRQHSYVVSADITKMYRQILVCPSQRNLQQILWRFDPSHPLETYSLNTVTYGTTAASFLATRCLIQLAEDSSHDFPEASKMISKDFYIDDLLTGSDSIPELVKRCQEITQILANGCLPLRKWVSNDPSVLEGIQSTISSSDSAFNFGPSDSSKILGLQWLPKLDSLQYAIAPSTMPKTVTKRIILSGISRIFDPLGLLSASTILIKMLMQHLWLERLDWDQSVPLDICTKWLSFRDQLCELSGLTIPRHAISKDSHKVELHGFSDASESAYGAAIYVRSVDQNGEVLVHLLCARSKVAPLKKISVPRLELCGAVILSRLSRKVIESFDLVFNNIFLWTDSTIVLGWINTPSHLLKTFVANRISEIQSNTKCEFWRHIDSKNNPADLLSRGLEPKQLKSSSLWWHGPPFLKEPEENWPVSLVQYQQNPPEMKSVAQSLVLVPDESFKFENYSNLSSLIRIIAYCLRFRKNCSSSRNSRDIGPLKTLELRNALSCILKQVQNQSFASEFKHLCNSKPISPKSKIISLNPFLDENGLIRVGGRLRHSDFSYEKRHPVLLPAHHHFTNLLFRHEHIKLMHAGPQHLLSIIREKYWPIGGRSVARKTVRECIRCFRVNPTHINPIMGDLPSARVTFSFPFAVTGVDYCGPFILKTRYGRNPSTYKAYVSLFICLATKAIHLELVTDLSTACFLSALRRFIARRGKPSQIMSDNGTNFVGSHNELKDLGNFLKSDKSEIEDSCSKNEIDWRFIPAYSPHFGGIWEAGVKSMKSHLKRVLANSKLTYEDFSTILTQIEGILNSRPLTPMSSDPSDLLPITPSHFLIGRSMCSIPESNIQPASSTHLGRYEHLQQLRQHFWRRWSVEYISELQQRQKWKLNQSSIEIGKLVLIKNKDMPPLNWSLGRVEELHSGADGIVRVVTLKTAKGSIRRAVANICPLPID